MGIVNKSPCEGSISINTRRRRRRTQMFALRKLRQILFYGVSKQNKQLWREDSVGDVFFSLSHSHTVFSSTIRISRGQLFDCERCKARTSEEKFAFD